MNKVIKLLWKYVVEYEILSRVYGLMIIAAVLLFIVFIASIKYYVFTVKVNEPIELSHGLIQRAAAYEKLISQTGSMDFKISKKSTNKNRIFGWFIDVSTTETKHAIEFINYSVETYDVLNNENLICGNLMHNINDKYDSDEIRIAEVISSKINDFNDKEYSSSKEILTQIFKREFPCI